MINSSSIKILRVFTKEEIKEFSDFLLSPFHNTNMSVVKLFEDLEKYYPWFDNKNLTKENIFAKIYPGKAYNEQTMKSALFNLGKLAEEFLSYKSYLNKGASRKYDLIFELMNRGQFELAEKNLKGYRDILEKNEGITDELLRDKMDYEILNTQLNFRRNKQQLPMGNIYMQAEYHIRFSLMRLANFIHDLRVNKIIFNASYDITFVEEYVKNLNLEATAEYLRENVNKNELNEITEIYVLRILFYLNPREEKYFFRLKELIIRNLNKFHPHEKYNMFQTLEALCWVLQQEVNRKKYDRESYNIYRLRLEHGVYSPDGIYMRIILYRAIMITLLLYPDYDYIQKFIESYIPRLPAEHRENMLNFSYALLHFSKKEYEQALEFAAKINFDLFTFRYDIRLLIFKVYYELNYFEEAYSLIDAHRHFIKTNKTVSERYREMHTNFLHFYSELLKSKTGTKDIDAGYMKSKINELNNIPYKEWFNEKIDERN